MIAFSRAAAGSAASDEAVNSRPAPAAQPQPHPALPGKPDPIPLPADLDLPPYSAGPPTFPAGQTLVYSASWMGLEAAQARVLVMRNRRQPNRWTGQMWITSSKAVDLLYRMRDYISEDFSNPALRPAGMYIRQHEKKRNDEWRVTFDHDAQLITSVKRNAQGRTWVRRFSGGDPLGPFSGAMMALSQPLAVGHSYTFDVFSGGNRYVFAFAVNQRERITTALGTFDALRIEPSVVWLSEGSFRTQARKTTIWVTADARHLPLRIESEVFIGTVRADLVRIDGAQPPAAQRTQLPPASENRAANGDRPGD